MTQTESVLLSYWGNTSKYKLTMMASFKILFSNFHTLSNSLNGSFDIYLLVWLKVWNSKPEASAEVFNLVKLSINEVLSRPLTPRWLFQAMFSNIYIYIYILPNQPIYMLICDFITNNNACIWCNTVPTRNLVKQWKWIYLAGTKIFHLSQWPDTAMQIKLPNVAWVLLHAYINVCFMVSSMNKIWTIQKCPVLIIIVRLYAVKTCASLYTNILYSLIRKSGWIIKYIHWQLMSTLLLTLT